ncbi:MAG TPA: lysis system i-spanin subunit Rz [Steroidobacter sp.]
MLAALWWLWSAVDKAGYERGVSEERAKWVARESEELAAANALIEKLQREARAAEQAHAKELAAISKRYQENLRNVEKARDAHIAALRAGALRLRDPEAPACESACGGGVSEASAAAGGRNGPAGGELSAEASEFLLRLTAEADEVARQLQACQEIIRSDRGE